MRGHQRQRKHGKPVPGRDPDALITELACSLVGHEGAINLAAGSRIEQLLGEVRVAELPGHPFFLATLFQPELGADAVHPVIRGFAQAVRNPIASA